ncbi:glutathione S-transferase family protein [Sphingomonas bacterium]|uniref:glutathione S-transferase family protein n=1 Tax=Sphingomonas bacterium TaxID=1895847 RepID=UPI00157767CD|nr:glutathione S-transferase family protein [Sphingomonas bacterium]
MTQPSLTLHHFPGACSRVTVCALEMASLDYDLALVDITKGAQNADAYLAISPLGKVPLLVADGAPLAENIAILSYIAALRPDSGIFPRDPSPRLLADTMSGLSFCAGTVHVQIRGLANPQRLTNGDVEGVREKSKELAKKSFGYAERRLAERGWWAGEPTIADVYVDWTFSVASRNGFDADIYPTLASFPKRLTDALPAYARMLEEEDRSRAALGL